MEQAILNEVISIRNRLGTIIKEANPKIGKDWVMFERIVAAHKNLRGIEIDKSVPMGDEKQPMLPGTPPRIDNICPTCANFETCEFGIKNQGGVADCASYQLMVPEELEGEDEGIETHEFTKIQDMPKTEFTPEEQERLAQIKEEMMPISLASFEVTKTAEIEGEEHTVFPDSDKRALLLSFLEPDQEAETKKRRRKKSE